MQEAVFLAIGLVLTGAVLFFFVPVLRKLSKDDEKH
jgi:hypothetical protein